MDVILLERIGKLGSMGEVVKVKDGFARNYLFPQHKALRATEANRAKFERDRATHEARNEERRKAAMGDSGKLEGKSFVLLRQAGESGQLYGSVSTRDIAEIASTAGVPVSRNHVLLDAPIKTIGLYTVQIALHPELSVPVTLNVARSQDEADAQSRGEVLTGPVSERAEALAAAEELFEQETAAEEEATEEETKN
ncbi:50S ribosomal protein L9 [Aestuariivirga sp. YIM B02566]|uniref:50S ribosomal protein L9 n=1 Tax=Taklimakanibacter albus TaxID=2800327 RepID=A0ACC5R095_9HYPH|nr:50S ribosomal protein L9 [Aestuariivirga sp. YIM B02566]MBK1866012.1 50S ribosomal protein L9 [Aestuariivirga sp. YIM B02566]